MSNSIFNPVFQQSNTAGKIVAGLERISEAFKVLLWEKAKQLGLSPIQIQILIFIAFHKNELCHVSHLAKEFNVTKPTISDAIRVLHNKGLIIRDYSLTDNRSYLITLSDGGEVIVSQTGDFAKPIKDQLETIEQSDLESLFDTLSKLIYQLNRNGILTVQRTCYGCKFYEKNEDSDFCKLLKQQLHKSDIPLDCPEFEE